LGLIQGFLLTDLADFAPIAAWQQIREEAIRTINRMSDRDIRNEDVKTRSFIIRKDPVTAQIQGLYDWLRSVCVAQNRPGLAALEGMESGGG
jgi:hypothetical protein